MKLLNFIAIYILGTHAIFSQNYKKCMTTKLVEYELSINKDYDNARKSLLSSTPTILQNSERKAATIIPIVVHIVHRNTHQNIGSGTNISNAQIQDQIRILNEDYSKTNPEFPNPPRSIFRNRAGNANLQFCLANIDPQGNPTNGITRTSSNRTNFDADDNFEANAMKLSSSGGADGWDPYNYLNIWVCDLTNSSGGGSTLGYAYLPGLLYGSGSNAWKDGLVVDYRYFGTTGVAAPSSDGRTATHEIGHYLGLNHTFCESGTGNCCDNDNNIGWPLSFTSVDDTPPTNGVYWSSVNASFPSTSSGSYNSCNDFSFGFGSDLPDMHENYMSYASDTWMFSNGQVSVMSNVLNRTENQGGRSRLKNGSVSVSCEALGIQENIINDFLIYPNPSTGKIKIMSKNNYHINTIKVFNLLGKNLYFMNNYSSEIELDLSHLRSGIYFIDIYTDKGTISKSLSIN
tara:strand:- start:48 stop:1424 length:1377 start_codon:yes stop_codon:yes gene_type:complete